MKNRTVRCLLFVASLLFPIAAAPQWIQTNGPEGGVVYCLEVSGTNLFTGGYGGVFLSTNNGTSWTAVNTGLTRAIAYDLTVSPAGGGAGTYLFAGTDEGVFLSTNNGTSWTAVNTGMTNAIVKALAVSPVGGGTSSANLFAGTADGVFLSTNNGTSWTAVNTGLTTANVNVLTVFPAGGGTGGTYLFAGTEGGGVFLSTNNGTDWTEANTGLTNKTVRTFAVSPAGGGTGGTNLFAGTAGGVFLSTNNGTNWTAVNTGLTNTTVNALTISPAGGGTGGTNLFAGTYGRGVFLSTNNGMSWTEVNTGLTNKDVRAFAVSPAEGGTGGTCLFAGTNGGGVYLSTNDGTSWTAVNTGLENTYVFSFAVGPSEGGSSTNVFVGVQTGVYLSTNNGTSWNATNRSLWTNIRALAISPGGSGSGTKIFAGTIASVFLSENNGTSWIAVDTGLPVIAVRFLYVSGTNLFEGTWGNGVWRRPISEMTATPPIAPTLASPADGATGMTTSPTLAWNVVEGADFYRLQVSSSESFSTMDYDDSTLTGTSRQVTGLAHKTKYHWRVRAKNLAGPGVFSDIWSFTTMPAVPAAPVLAEPADGATGTAVNPTLRWNAVEDAVTYRLQVSSAESFSTMVYDDSTLTGTSRQVSGLTHKTKYNWRVRAKNAAGSGAFSDTWSFMTIPAVPLAPVLAEPTDGTAGLTATPTLRWNAVEGATTYRLQVSITPSFSSTVYDDSMLTGTSRQVSGLAHKTMYYWRVRAKNAAGSGTFSVIWVFTTMPAVPPAPVLAEPADGTKGTALNPTLRWNAVEDAATYRLQVSTTPAFSTTVFDDSTLTVTSKEVGPLNGNTDYYWRVAAKNEAVRSPFSAIWVFTTGTSAVGRIGDGTPAAYALEQNYPNPFNSRTTIRFSLPRAGRATLKVYDSRGNETATLVSRELDAGIYEATWDAGACSAASGIYFYRLQAGDRMLVKKLILIK